MSKRYSDRSNARKAAKALGLDLNTLEFFKAEDGRYGWKPRSADADTEAAAQADEAAAEDQAEAAQDTAPEAQAETPAGEIAQPGTIDAMIDAVAADLTAQAAEAAAESQQAGLAAIQAEDAALNPALTYTISARIERKALWLAQAAAQDFAKALGMDLMLTGPDGQQYAIVAGSKKPSAPKAAAKARPASSAPRAPRKAPILSENGMPLPPDFSAETHKRFRGKLAELVRLAADGDIAGLRDYPINPVSSSPKALDRYRNAAVAALEARAGKAVAA